MKLKKNLAALDPSTLSPTAHHWLAFSGGPDSLCLLHLLIQAGLQQRLSVVHIDHGLDDQSSARAAQAKALAEQLGQACAVETLSAADLDLPGGPEAAARQARYARLNSLMAAGDHLLTAHHSDDQIETVLLRLLRASGAIGLAGMQPIRSFEPGWLARPLLHSSQRQILDYLEQHDLTPVIDPTNRDTSLDRNYLRQTILPLIETRWPGYRSALLKSSELMKTAGLALENQAAQDFEYCRRSHINEITVALEPWLQLESNRAMELIRHWCRIQKIEPPPAARLQEWTQQCHIASADRQPALDWKPARLRRWANALWLDHKPQPANDWQLQGAFDSATPLNQTLPHGLGDYQLLGDSTEPPGKQWQIDGGHEGDRMQIHAGRSDQAGAPTQAIAELMRVKQIPPWRRHHWPRLRIDGTLVAVGDHWLAPDFQHWLKQHAMELKWNSI